jgi:hypothetical protein
VIRYCWSRQSQANNDKHRQIRALSTFFETSTFRSQALGSQA